MHIVSVHEGKKPFKCDMCDANLKQQGHIASVHENKKPFRCEICSISFGRKPNLKKTYCISS